MAVPKIKSIKARKILDSGANFTLEVEVTTEEGRFCAGVPSGASKGKYEAVVLETDMALESINKNIASELVGRNVADQAEIDHLMIDLDGSEDKSNLGANAIVGVSMAVCRAGAESRNIPLWKYVSRVYKTKPALPLPAFNIINGGAHAETHLAFQEFMAVIDDYSVKKNLEKASRLYGTLKEVIGARYGRPAVNVGYEGGFAPPIRFPEEAIELILTAANNLGIQKKIKIALDVAASHFFTEGKYKTGMGVFTQEGLLDYYAELIKKYPIISLEDPFEEEDWQGFSKITKKFGKKVVIIGDDLLATNPARIREAKEKDACNGLLLKVNQIGTVTEAVDAANLARSMGWKLMVSHRSGETNDDFISDLAVGLGADFLKAGAPARGERVAKYNRLLKIEEEL